MKRKIQKGNPDAFDLAWLDDEELHKLQEAMVSYRENELCGYWLHCLNEQIAIRAGKLRIMPGAEVRDPDLKQYPISDLHAARLILESTSKPQVNRPASAFVKCWFNVAKAGCYSTSEGLYALLRRAHALF
jgi:hypothetical protein